MVTDDLITAPLIVPNTLHHGPAKLRATHVLDGGVEGSENVLAYIHRVVYLARPLDCAIPHMAHGAFAVMPCIVQLTLPHLLVPESSASIGATALAPVAIAEPTS